MAGLTERRPTARVGSFEVDFETGELHANGSKTRIQEQPLEILALLIQRPGEVLTREQIRDKLWPADTSVDFEHSINTAVKKLRAALGDDPVKPAYIETLPRKGYRLIAPVVRSATAAKSQRHQLVFTLSLAAGLSVSAGLWIWHTAAQKSPPESTMADPVLLTGSLGTKSEPAFSPDGRRVAFTWDGPNQDNTDIYVTQIGDSEPVRLTSDTAVEHAPAWSPDGLSIAFLRQLPDNRTGIFIVPAAGGTPRKLTELGPGTAMQQLRARPSWHPGGRWIVVSRATAEGEPGSLYLLSIETREKRRLTYPPTSSHGDVWPALSPDGHMLVFVRAFTDSRQDLYSLALSGDLRPVNGPNRITLGNPFNTQPAWSTDGKSIVYVSGISQHHPSLWKMSFDGPVAKTASARQLPLTDANWPAASHSRLVYGRRIWDFDVWRLELGRGRRRERLASNSTRLEHTPEYSPDGTRIAFASDRTGSHEIWVCDSDGSHPVKLTSFGGPYVAVPAWSPDSRRLAFAVRIGAEDEIYLLDSQGGTPEHLVQGGGPTWSRDGKWIYFGSKRTGTWQVWKVPVVGGSPVQVTRQGGAWGVESVDGRFFYYRLNGEVWRMRAQGGGEKRIIPASDPQDFEVVERGIYFVSASDRPAIQFFDFRTGRTETVAGFGEPATNPASHVAGWGLSVSPDRRSLLFTKREDRSVDLMLVDRFR